VAGWHGDDRASPELDGAAVVTWTAEELRAGGWAEQDVTGYRAGVAAADALLAEIESRPAPEDRPPEPPVGETQARAQELAALLVGRSDRLDAEKAAERRAELMRKAEVTVIRPGDPDPPDVVRRRALEHVLQGGVVIARPGKHNQPRQMVMRVGDETRIITVGGVPERIVFGPADADRLERVWDYAARRREDQWLIAAYGLKECQQAGILVTGAADGGEYAKVQLPPGLEGL
jgi:hypothetical protein